jgi:NAD(P)-dependent dehydrogenase (short-subunit alcohol dehydrogenase family)
MTAIVAVMEISLEGKVALVTGASRGIGKAIAKSYVEAGAKVMLMSRKEDVLRSAADEIGGDTAIFAGNAGDIDTAQACVAATIKKFGQIDIFVNNAATNPYAGPTLGIDPARYDKTFQVNLRGPLFWCQAVWEAWMIDHPGVIINIASVGGLRAEGNLGVYNLTKAALIHLTKQLAGELGLTRVVGIAPGLVQTDFAQMLVDNFGDALAKRLPTKRLGVPQDIANLATFLASDLASWMTGETYLIDGGAGVSSGGM